MILAICVVVDESKCLDIPIWEFSIILERAFGDADFGQTDFGHPYWTTLAKSDFGHPYFTEFGQADFGHPYFTEFGQADFGQIGCFSLTRRRRVGPRRVRPRRVGPRRVGPVPKGGGAQNFALFFPLPPTFSLLFCLSGCLLVDFWCCLKWWGPEMSTFGEPKRAHF